MSSSCFFFDSAPTPLEFEEMFRQEIHFFLYFWYLFPVGYQGVGEFLFWYCIDMVDFLIESGDKRVEIFMFRLDFVMLPSIETHRHSSAFEGVEENPFLVWNSKEVVGVSDVFTWIVDQDENVVQLISVGSYHLWKSTVDALELRKGHMISRSGLEIG